MDDRTQKDLSRLLEAESASDADAAWAAFVEQYTPLMLHVARSLGGDRDAAMDRYAYVLERLVDDDFRRLRAFVPDGKTRFTTWLVVVVRRLCLDQYRARYGRPRSAAGEYAQRVRRNLADCLESEIDITHVASNAPDPEQELLSGETRARLAGAVAALPPGDRLVLALRFQDERSAREIAEIMAFPTPFHVYRCLNRLLIRLREALSVLESGDEGLCQKATRGSPSVQ